MEDKPIMPDKVSLRATLSELDRVTADVKSAAAVAPPAQKRKLQLKIKKLTKVRKELAQICHGSFIVVPPPGESQS